MPVISELVWKLQFGKMSVNNWRSWLKLRGRRGLCAEILHFLRSGQKGGKTDFRRAPDQTLKKTRHIKCQYSGLTKTRLTIAKMNQSRCTEI